MHLGVEAAGKEHVDFAALAAPKIISCALSGSVCPCPSPSNQSEADHSLTVKKATRKHSSIVVYAGRCCVFVTASLFTPV